MNDIAFAVFGTCDGTNGFVSPKTFSLPSPLHIVIDTSLPFLWNTEVFRSFQVETSSAGNLQLLALYTKIDDFGGPREGAFAGVGIFVRNGVVDHKLLVTVLREMLANLVAAASNGKQFVVKIDAAAEAENIRPPKDPNNLIASFVKKAWQYHTPPKANRVLVRRDSLVDSAETFFSFTQEFSGIFGRDAYYSESEAFNTSALANFDIIAASPKEALVRAYKEQNEYIRSQQTTYQRNLAEKQRESEVVVSEATGLRAKQQELEKKSSNDKEEIQKLKSDLKETTLSIREAEADQKQHQILKRTSQELMNERDSLDRQKIALEASNANYRKEIARYKSTGESQQIAAIRLQCQNTISGIDGQIKSLGNAIENLKRRLEENDPQNGYGRDRKRRTDIRDDSQRGVVFWYKENSKAINVSVVFLILVAVVLFVFVYPRFGRISGSDSSNVAKELIPKIAQLTPEIEKSEEAQKDGSKDKEAKKPDQRFEISLDVKGKAIAWYVVPAGERINIKEIFDTTFSKCNPAQTSVTDWAKLLAKNNNNVIQKVKVDDLPPVWNLVTVQGQPEVKIRLPDCPTVIKSYVRPADSPHK